MKKQQGNNMPTGNFYLQISLNFNGFNLNIDTKIELTFIYKLQNDQNSG